MRRVLLWLLFSSILRGDGGTVLLRSEAPPFTVTVFDDLTVLVQDFSTLAPILDAQVYLRLNAATTELRLGRGQNKILYSASVDFPSSGDLPYAVTVSRHADSVSVTGSLRVAVASPGTPVGAIAVVPVVALLFWCNQFLRRRNR